MRISSTSKASLATIPYVFRSESMRRARILVNTEKIREAWLMFKLNLRLDPQDHTALLCIYEIK